MYKFLFILPFVLTSTAMAGKQLKLEQRYLALTEQVQAYLALSSDERPSDEAQPVTVSRAAEQRSKKELLYNHLLEEFSKMARSRNETLVRKARVQIGDLHIEMARWTLASSHQGSLSTEQTTGVSPERQAVATQYQRDARLSYEQALVG